MSCVIKSFYIRNISISKLYMSLHDSIYGLGPQCNALRRLSRETEQTPMPSAHAQQAVAVYLELDHSADGCLAVILFRMRSDMLMRQIK